jgi:hypothetical protein
MSNRRRSGYPIVAQWIPARPRVAARLQRDDNPPLTSLILFFPHDNPYEKLQGDALLTGLSHLSLATLEMRREATVL